MVMRPHQEQLSFSIINTEMTVEAMRDSGYKSTTHALAELIDNSIEAGGREIEVFGLSRRDPNVNRLQLRELAVLDNGVGMDSDTLRGSLRYGHGTRRQRSGIGRFGVGLPNASMSQATRVDVWSWQNGVTNALHTWLSISDVQGGRTEIPQPRLTSIPEAYRTASQYGFGESGTLVVWSHLDRVAWKRAATTFRHTEALIGRLYRRFLANPTDRLHTEDRRSDEIGARRTIVCIPVEESAGIVTVNRDGIVRVRPNDPLYLMRDTSCPEDFGAGPMFQELEASPFTIPFVYKGNTHTVRIRASHACSHVRDSTHPDADWPEKWKGRDAGHTPWGKHANHNMGVSIVRAHREVDLDPSWTIGYEPTERWWTVEVDFPPALDELFGITNNKQGAMTIQRLSSYDVEREKLPGEETPGDVRRRMEADGDPRLYLLDLQRQIQQAIKIMKDRNKASKKSRPRHQEDEEAKADAKATAAIKRRIEEGIKSPSDIAEETGTKEDHIKAQVAALIEKYHLDAKDALRRVTETYEANHRVRWIQASQTSPAFFDVEPQPGVVQVVLNTNHPVHSHLYDVMHPAADDMSEQALHDRLTRAAAAFRILIYAWARYEDEQTDATRRRVRNARIEWGKYAEEFFEDDDGLIPPANLV